MQVEKDDYADFFYNAGLHIGEYFGNKSDGFKRKSITQFFAFINIHGGVDRFVSSEEAVRQFLRKTRGGTRVFTKY